MKASKPMHGPDTPLSLRRRHSLAMEGEVAAACKDSALCTQHVKGNAFPPILVEACDETSSFKLSKCAGGLMLACVPEQT
jgi:hypothetical protein